MKKYTVRIYFSGYVTRELRARSNYLAVVKARKAVFHNLESVKPTALHTLPEIQKIIETLEHWKDADTAEEAA